MTRHGVDTVKILKIENNQHTEQDDLLVVEEPLEIRMGYGPLSSREQKSLAVTLRTPGNDLELALGFFYSEGIIDNLSEVESVKYCEDVEKPEEKGNVVRVEISPDIKPDFQSLERNFYMTSSCGVCGKASIDAVRVSCEKLPSGPVVDKSLIEKLPGMMEEKQVLFDHTGGLHASCLFTHEGKMIVMREDVGRHNAVDKIVGACLSKKLWPLQNNILCLSGRAGFELVQKAIRAGISIVAAVGAPSSLSVNLANEFGLTLIGFLKKGKFNIYSNPERIIL